MNRTKDRTLMWLVVGFLAIASCTAESGSRFRMVAQPDPPKSATLPGGGFVPAVTPVPTVPSVETGSEIQALIEEGYLRLRLEDYDGAIEAFTTHIDDNGAEISAYLGRGRALAGAGDLDRAIEDFSLAISIDSEFPDLYEERADAFIAAGRLEEALDDLAQLARLRPGDPVAYRQRALVHLDLDRPELVAGEIDRAGAVFGKSAVDHYIMGLAQFRLEDYESALASQTRALDVSRDQDLGNNFGAAVLTSRGETNFRLERHDQAYEDFSRALQLGGPDVLVYELRARVYYSQERYEEAAADHALAVEIDPNDATLYNNLADSRMLAGNFELALGTIDTALRLDPNLGIAHYTKGEILEKMGRLDAANESFTRAAELNFTADSIESLE